MVYNMYMRQKKIVKYIRIGLHKPQVDLLKRIEESGMEYTSIIRQLLNEYARTFKDEPGYVTAQRLSALARIHKVTTEAEKDKMTEEDYVEKVLRGQVRGGVAFFRIASGREIRYPLSGIKRKNRENTPVIDIHNQLLDGVFMFGDRQITPEELEDVWDGWSDRRPAWHQIQEDRSGE